MTTFHIYEGSEEVGKTSSLKEAVAMRFRLKELHPGRKYRIEQHIPSVWSHDQYEPKTPVDETMVGGYNLLKRALGRVLDILEGKR